MKKSKFTKIAALALAGCMLTSSINANASENPNIDDVLEDIFDDLENGETIIPGEKVFEDEQGPITIKDITDYSEELKVGDVVSVFGFGYQSSDGLGKQTRVYVNETLAVVGIKSSRNYPYALVEINEDGSLSDVIGWFPTRSIRSRYTISSVVDHADVLRTIVPADDERTKEEGEMDWFTHNQFYDLGDDYAVKAEYIWPEPIFDYDYILTTRYNNQKQICEFYSEDGNVAFLGVYDWKNGSFYYQTNDVARDVLKETPKELGLKYNITSN